MPPTFRSEYKKTSLYTYRRLEKAIRYFKKCLRIVIKESFYIK